jgi:UPF0755 protein
MSKATTRILILLGMAIALTGGALYLAFEQYNRFLNTPLSIPAAGYVVQIESGMPAIAVVRELDQLGFTRMGWKWKVLMRLEPPEIRSGEFRLTAGLKPRELLNLLSSGSVVQYRFTVVEGWTYTQLLAALSQNETLEQTTDDLVTQTWPHFLPDSDITHPEGWFLPETYLFTRGDTTADILRRSYHAMKETLAAAWRERDADLPLNSPYELLILASIIEKETSRDSERKEIAGVFLRRLKKNMRLQTDPTVIYGIGENYDGNIRRKDLRADTPYNTYTRHGLPPTPIALPGRRSLFAAGQPDDGDSLYFVADGKGGHTFSRTLEEHNKAVRKLIGKG